MKEATGELNMTVVTVVAIAAVGAFFYAFVWPAIKTNIAKNTCANACPGGKVSNVDLKANTCTCGDNSVINIDEAKDEVAGS